MGCSGELQMKKRNLSMDLIRCIALVSVVSVHFFQNSGFYDEPMDGQRMLVMTIMRTAFMVCVPLFVMLSGYLMCNKTVSGRYYYGLLKTVGVYLIACVGCIIYRSKRMGVVLTAKEWLFSIFDFSAIPLSWYVEMYLGLFLLIPFLNSMYHGLTEDRHKKALIGTMLILTALPGIFNIYNWIAEGWWLNPRSLGIFQDILPNWWVGIYPVTYYLIGVYIAEHKPKMNFWLNGALVGGSVLVFGLYNYWRSYGVTFAPGAWTDWGALPIVVMTTLLFVWVSNFNLEWLPEWGKKLLKQLSDLCFGAYLASWIFDQEVYTILNTKVPAMRLRLNYFAVVVPVIVVCAFLLSWVYNMIYKVLSSPIRKVYEKQDAEIYSYNVPRKDSNWKEPEVEVDEKQSVG